MGYQIMFYGGLAGALITLPIAVWLFVKLGIIQVIEDITGIRFRKASKRNYRYRSHVTRSGKRTTNEIQLKKENVKAEIASANEREQLRQQIESTTLLSEQELAETTVLSDSDETTLLTETEVDFVIEKDIMIIHSSLKI